MKNLTLSALLLSSLFTGSIMASEFDRLCLS